MGEVMAVPKLRFKEFDGDWESKKLGTFAKTFSGGTPTSSNKDYYNGDIPFIKSGEISCTCTEQFINQKGLDSSSAKMVNQGDLLYALYGATSGQVAISQIHGAINQAVLCIRSEQNTVFLYNFFLLAKDDILSTYLQGGQGNLSAQILKNIEIPIPQLAEQTKIANFLSAVDTKIATLSQKVELLSQYKQGMMQKLFSQQIRFKADDGSEFREWEEKKLSEISQKAMYGMNAAATEYDGINKYLRITDICEFSNKFKMSNLTSPNAELEDKYKLQLGDLLFARTGASVGKSYLYNEDDGITYFAGFLIKFSLNINLVIPYFIFLQTLTKEFSQWVVTNSMRSGQPGINAEEYSSYILKVPCLEEQTKIANFLSAIDQKIEVVAQQIEQAKQWKKGLLQQMFV